MMRFRQQRVALVLVGLAVISAGCGSLGGGTGTSSAAGPENPTVIDAVPERADIVVMTDPVGLMTDPTTESIANTVLSDFGQSGDFATIRDDAFQQINANISEQLAELGVEAELTVSDIGRVAVFGDQTGSIAVQQGSNPRYAGTIFQADLTAAEVSSIVSEAREELPESARDSITETTYKGVPLYLIDTESLPTAQSGMVEQDTGTQAFAVLDSDAGIHVAGSEQSVKDAIDTYQGDAPGLPADMRPPLNDQTYVSVGVNTSSPAVQSMIQQQATSLPETPEGATGAFQTSDDGVTISFALTFDSAETAQTAAEQAREDAADTGQFDTTVSVDDRTVSVEVDATTTQAADAIRSAVQVLLRFSASGMPAAS